jgi:predicted HicB family RNase H-like nuclease
VATCLLKAKVTPAEHARIVERAKAAGCSLSEYVRSRCLSD